MPIRSAACAVSLHTLGMRRDSCSMLSLTGYVTTVVMHGTVGRQAGRQAGRACFIRGMAGRFGHHVSLRVGPLACMEQER